MQERQTCKIAILLRISRTNNGQIYEILQGESLKKFLERQKLARYLFQDYHYFNEKEDNRSWQPIAPIKIKLKKDKFLASKSKKSQLGNKDKKTIQLVRVIEYSDKKISYQEISGQRLKEFLEEMSWAELVIQNYQLAYQNIHWLETEPVKIKILENSDY
jgi:hypothetical protein